MISIPRKVVVRYIFWHLSLLAFGLTKDIRSLRMCSGSICRSPMAAAIGNAELAARLKIPFEALDKADAQALSAGVSARAGAPLMPEAQQALRLIGVPVGPGYCSPAA